MKTIIIAAVARNRAIGKDNKLIYWLPNDLKRFRQLTTGHTIVMGRKTFDSLPKGALPNRRNCVLTRSQKHLAGCECFATWAAFVASCQPDEEVYIIGGASLYRQLIDKADRLCLTEVDDTPKVADTFFPTTNVMQAEAPNATPTASMTVIRICFMCINFCSEPAACEPA